MVFPYFLYTILHMVLYILTMILYYLNHFLAILVNLKYYLLELTVKYKLKCNYTE